MRILDADIDETAAGPVFRAHLVAPTLGWTNVGLSPRVYIVPPEDGLQEIVINATAPTGLVAQMPQLFAREASLPVADWVRGVRILDQQGADLLTLYALVKDAPPIGGDTAWIKSSGLRGEDKLLVEVSYGGGCRPHYFQLSWDGTVEKTQPPRVTLVLSHNAHADPCKALFTRTLQFDLSTALPLASTYQILVAWPEEPASLVAHSPFGLLPPIVDVVGVDPLASDIGVDVGPKDGPEVPFPMKLR